MALAMVNMIGASSSSSSSSLGLQSREVVNNLWQQHGKRRPSSLELRSAVTQFRGRSCSVSVLPAATTVARLVVSKRTKLFCSAMQTDVLVEDTASPRTLEKLKELVDLQGGNSKTAADEELLRFLLGESLDTQRAAEAFTTHQKRRSEFLPKGYFTEADLPTELEAKKAYWISQDKKGRPVLLSLARNHFYNKNFDEFKRFLVYALDRLAREVPPSSENFICIVDLKGLGLKNLDSKSFIVAFEMLQKHYPGRLDKAFMVIFVDKNKLDETLSNEIDLEFLPQQYGGKANLVPLQDALTWPPSS